MALSDDLRKRWWGLSLRRAVAQPRPGFQDQHRERGALGEAIRDDGGDFAQALWRRSPLRRIEAHHDYLMGLIRRTPDITMLESKSA